RRTAHADSDFTRRSLWDDYPAVRAVPGWYAGARLREAGPRQFPRVAGRQERNAEGCGRRAADELRAGSRERTCSARDAGLYARLARPHRRRTACPDAAGVGDYQCRTWGLQSPSCAATGRRAGVVQHPAARGRARLRKDRALRLPYIAVAAVYALAGCRDLSGHEHGAGCDLLDGATLSDESNTPPRLRADAGVRFRLPIYEGPLDLLLH